MLLRLLIFAALAAFIYRAVKSWQRGTTDRNDKREMPRSDQVDDVMIQDPVCGIYFPRRNAVALRIENQDLHFCSAACRDRYVEEHGRDQAP